MAEAANSRPKQSTYHSFAIWRFMAALIIMVYHYVYYTQNGPARALWLEHLLPLLDMFFMMSGFLLYENYASKITDMSSYRGFLLKRLARLYPLHLITLLFFVVVALLSPHGGTGQYTWSTLPANFFLVQAWGGTDALDFNFVAWSLSAEWFCYLMMPVVILCGKRLRVPGLLVLAGVAYLATHVAINNGWADGNTVAQTKTWGAYRALGSFAIGAAAVQVMQSRTFAVRSHLWGWIVMALSIFAMFAEWNFYFIIAIMAGALILSASAEKDNAEGMVWSRPIMPLMAVSYGIYMWHPVVGKAFASVVWKRFLVHYVDFPISYYLIACCVISVVVAVISQKVFEQPVANWIISRFAKRQRAKIEDSAVIAGE